MAMILWITHRDIENDLTRTSRLGISNALENHGHSISWMAPSISADVVVNRSRKLGLGHRSFTKSIRKKIQHAPSPEIAIVEWTAVEGAYRELRTKSIPWIMMDRSPPTSRGIVGLIQRIQYRKAWKIARNQSIGVAVKSNYHYDSTSEIPFVIVPGGVDCSLFDIERSERESPLLINHGSISKVRELEKLVRMGLDVRFIGSGDAVNQLRSIGARVDDACPSEQIPFVLSEADIGLMHLPDRPEWRGASPLKVSEYAASGMCVVCSDVSGLSEFRDEEWLSLVPLGDDDAFHSAINELLDCEISEIRKRGESAQIWARKYRDWSVCVSDLEKLINQSLNESQ
jgi:glycosyltransferase involved in cell wall biosynthesis